MAQIDERKIHAERHRKTMASPPRQFSWRRCEKAEVGMIDALYSICFHSIKYLFCPQDTNNALLDFFGAGLVHGKEIVAA